MVAVRRWYVFLVSAISLQAVVWGLIALLPELYPAAIPTQAETLAIQIAVIVVALPFYLTHWGWAQRLAARDQEERASLLRRTYLYAMLAIFVAGLAYELYDLLLNLLGQVFGVARTFPSVYKTLADTLTHDGTAIVVLAVFALYHWRLAGSDTRLVPDRGSLGVVRRLYVLMFSGVGLILTTISVIALLDWLIQLLTAPSTRLMLVPAPDLARLIIGLPLWVLFWMQAQKLFLGANREERESVLRKLYLYLAVFIAALGMVVAGTALLAALLGRALGVLLDSELRGPAVVLVVLSVVWFYHTLVLREDANRAEQLPQQALIRRLYLYLAAGIGLGAFLIGTAGDVSVLIRALGEQSLGTGLREQLAWFTAALIAGLPFWFLAWRVAQIGAATPGATGTAERRSTIRKLYLYFYLFAATMTVLGCATYILYRLLNIVLGGQNRGNLYTDLGQPIAFGLIAIGVWLYHGLAVRGDGQRTRDERAERLKDMRVAVVDTADGQWGCALLEALKREIPGLGLAPIGLTAAAATAMGGGTLEAGGATVLKQARLIVGPSSLMLPTSATPDVMNALTESPARKFLVPAPFPGWEWIGLEESSASGLVQQAVRAVKLAVEGDEVKGSPWNSIGAAIAILITLCILAQLVPALLAMFFSRF